MKLFHTLTTLILFLPLTFSLPVHTPRLRVCDSSCHSCVSHPSLTSPICLPFSSTPLIHTTLRQASSTGGLTGDACATQTDCSPGRGCGRLQNDGSIATCADPSDACFCFPTDFEICDASGECIPGEVCAQEAQGNVQLCVAKTSPLLEEAEEEKKEVVAVDAGKGDKDLPTVPPVTTIPQAPPATPPQQASPEPKPAQESTPVTTPAATAAVTTPTAVPVEETPTETAVASAEPSVAAGSQEPAPAAVPAPVESETVTETEESVSESETENGPTEEASLPVGTPGTETETTEEGTTTGVTGVPTETDEEELESEDPSVTGEDDESVDGAAVDDNDSDADGDDGDDDDDDEDEICIGVHHLQDVDSLVYDTHRKAKVLCDSMGSCATPGHIVHWKGQAMMMISYCELAQEECVKKSMRVNSPSWKRGLRVKSLTDNLEFTAFAARYATRTEERLLTTAVRMGL